MKKAMITGITGQDGAYLAKLLLEKGYRVFGTYRRTSCVNFWRIEELGIKNHECLDLVELDITDTGNCIRILEKTQPDEIYNLAAQSFVAASFDMPLATAQITGVGALHLLEAVRTVNPKIRFYQASSSEMFGKVNESPQTEKTPFYPRSPYGVSKVFAHWTAVNYREAYNIFTACGILFNHESPLRGIEFVTRKITDGVAKIFYGDLDCLELGNLNAQRDWGHAEEYVEGMWRMLQHDQPDTFVLATGSNATIRHFVTMAFEAIDISLSWHGEFEKEVGVIDRTDKVVVRVNPDFYRPAEVDVLVGDATKAKEALGWRPRTSLEDLCKAMVHSDMRRVQNWLKN